MRPWTRPALGLSLLLTILGLALGCRQEVPPLFRRNQPPETTLTIVPEDSTQGFYRYHVYWRGEDPDGHVVRYIFAITDTLSRNEEENWDPQLAEDRERSFFTTKTDSVFIFDSERGRQSFNISAIDDYGRLDRTPARAFFRIVDNGLPRVEFLDVRAARSDLIPCSGAEPCTIPNFTNFKIRFTGTTRNNRITGFQWQGIRPGDDNPEPVQPLGAESLFVAPPAAGDTLIGRSPDGIDTLWTIVGDVVTVYYRSKRVPPGGEPADSIASGSFLFRARVRDEASLKSLIGQGTRRVTINFDPDTELLRIPYCDCPNAPQPCSRTDRVHVGFVTGVDRTTWKDSLPKWIPFCDGDTLPIASQVRFFARGWDDRRDEPVYPDSGLKDVGFSYRFAWRSPGGGFNGNMPLSSEYRPMDVRLPPTIPWPPLSPDGRWHGGLKGWGDLPLQGLCPFDFTFYASAVDEHGKRDGTPDSLSFSLSAPPVVDSLAVDSLRSDPDKPLVVVFVPGCNPQLPDYCPDVDPLPVFGLDTILVIGRYVPDPAQPSNPVKGSNVFTFPFAAYGHDDRRDRGTPGSPFQGLYSGDTGGRIRAWKFGFDCIVPEGGTCNDLAISGEGDWRSETSPPDSAGTQIFDDSLRVTLQLETEIIGSSVKLVLPSAKFGHYNFILQARDTDAIGQRCDEPSDLGKTPTPFPRFISDLGRTSQVDTLEVQWVQYRDVRPSAPQAPQKQSFWKATRKKVWR